MSDLENRLRQASDEIRAIRAEMDVLNLSIARQKTKSGHAAVTFCSVRKNSVHYNSLGGKSSSFSNTRTPRFNTLQDQFTHLADLDQFVFTNKCESIAD